MTMKWFTFTNNGAEDACEVHGETAKSWTETSSSNVSCDHGTWITANSIFRFMATCQLCESKMWGILNVVRCLDCGKYMHGTCASDWKGFLAKYSKILPEVNAKTATHVFLAGLEQIANQLMPEPNLGRHASVLKVIGKGQIESTANRFKKRHDKAAVLPKRQKIIQPRNAPPIASIGFPRQQPYWHGQQEQSNVPLIASNGLPHQQPYWNGRQGPRNAPPITSNGFLRQQPDWHGRHANRPASGPSMWNFIRPPTWNPANVCPAPTSPSMRNSVRVGHPMMSPIRGGPSMRNPVGPPQWNHVYKGLPLNSPDRVGSYMWHPNCVGPMWNQHHVNPSI